MSPTRTSTRNRMLGVWLLSCVAPTVVATVNERTCFRYTGQSCFRSSFCEKQSGPAKCKGFRCFCLDHACAGVDKKCHTGTNKDMEDVAAGQTYTIRNLKFSNLNLKARGSMVAPRDMSNDFDGEIVKYQWTLRKPPATNPGRPAYLLYSKRWPDAVMAMQTCPGYRIASNVSLDDFQDFLMNPNLTNNTMQETGGYEYNVSAFSCVPSAHIWYVQGPLYGIFPDLSLPEFLSYLVKPPKMYQEANPGKRLVMIQNIEKYFLFVTAGGPGLFPMVRTQRTDHATAGYHWFFEPPLPAELYDELPSYSEVSVAINTAPVRSPHKSLVFSVAYVLLAMVSS